MLTSLAGFEMSEKGTGIAILTGGELMEEVFKIEEVCLIVSVQIDVCEVVVAVACRRRLPMKLVIFRSS